MQAETSSKRLSLSETKKLQPEKMDSNLLPLKEMLRDDFQRECILAYATKNYQDESLLFWLAADAFTTLPAEKRFAGAHEIWEKFLEASSEYEVTVEANGRTAMHEYLKGLKEEDEIDCNLFEAMKLELENVMTSNVYSEFCKQARKMGRLDFAIEAKKETTMTEAEMEQARRKGASLMENLVVEPDNYSVLYALCQVYTINESHESDEKGFLSGVMEMLLEHNSMLPFMRYVVTREIAECSEVNTLFRGRTVFTLLLGDILRRRPCHKFLSECTASTFTEVLRQKSPLEPDPMRIDGSTNPEKDSIKNAEKIIKIADSLVETIRKKYSKCPPSLRKVFEMLSVVTAEKWPHLRWTIVGSVFFLRFINPALSQPELHGLVSKEISMGTRRGLIIISKMIQFVTNNSRFDNSTPANKLLNSWVDDQIKGIETLFSQLIIVEDKDWLQLDIGSPNHQSAVKSPGRNSGVHLTAPGSGSTSPQTQSPRWSSTRLADKIKESTEKVKTAMGKSDKLARNLTAEESMALRLQVLDTLIKYQKEVKDLLSASMATTTQWVWLKESLSTFLI